MDPPSDACHHRATKPSPLRTTGRLVWKENRIRQIENTNDEGVF